MAAEVRMAFRDAMAPAPLPKRSPMGIYLMDTKAYLGSVVTSSFYISDDEWYWYFDLLGMLEYLSQE